MSSRFALLFCAMTISLSPLAHAETVRPTDACTLRLGPTTGLHMAPSGSVRRVVAIEPLGTGRYRGECGSAAPRRA